MRYTVILEYVGDRKKKLVKILAHLVELARRSGSTVLGERLCSGEELQYVESKYGALA